MASPQAITAVIRSASPTFRNNHDRLAFAVHAAILTSGYRLVAVGEEAERAEGLPADAPEVPITGWDSASGEQYTFAYLPDAEPCGSSGSGQNAARPLLVKALALGDVLLVSLARLGEGGPEPQVLELDTSRYTTADTSSVAKSLSNLDELVKRITWALDAVAMDDDSKKDKAQGAAGGDAKAGEGKRTPAEADADAAADAAAAKEEMRAAGRPGRAGGGRPDHVDEFTPARPFFDPDLDPLMGGGPRIPFPEGPVPRPLRAGEEDIMPPGGGFGPPGIIPGPPLPGGGGGGGMYVGPNHPYFAGRTRGPPRLPPGAHWDPIRPQGLEGWSPDDFVSGGNGGGQRGGPPGIDPDVGPPPPGRGPDIDSMYG